MACESTKAKIPKLPSPLPDGSLLWSAWVQSEKNTERTNRIYLYSRLVPLWFKAGNQDAVSAVLTRWKDLYDQLGEGSSSRKVGMALASAYLAYDNQDEGLRILNDIWSEIKDSQATRGIETDYDAFLRICFAFPEETVNLLKSAIIQVYIVNDSWTRLNLLIGLSEFYQGEGGRRSYNLLQQAVPSALSILNPFRKSEALSRLAQGFAREGFTEDSSTFSKQAMELLRDQEVLLLSPADQISLTQTLLILAELGYPSEISGFLPLIESPNAKISVQAKLASVYTKNKQNFLFRLALQRLVSFAADANTNNLVLQQLGMLLYQVKTSLPTELAQVQSLALKLMQNNNTAPISAYVLAEYAAKLADADLWQDYNLVETTIEDKEIYCRLLLRVLASKLERNSTWSALQKKLDNLLESDARLAEIYLLEAALLRASSGDWSIFLGALQVAPDDLALATALLDAAVILADSGLAEPEEITLAKLRYSR